MILTISDIQNIDIVRSVVSQMSKKFRPITTLELSVRSKKLKSTLELVIPKMLKDINATNHLLSLSFNNRYIEHNEAWNNLISQLSKCATYLINLGKIEYLLYCISKYCGDRDLSEYPKLNC